MQDNFDTYIDKIKEFKPKRSVVIVGIIFLIAIIVIVVVANLVTRSNNRQPDMVGISNYQDVSVDIPTETRNNLNAQIYYLLSLHFDNLPTDANSINATIRPDTLEENNTNEVRSATFVVDVDDYKQTYNVTASWSDSLQLPNDIIIECAPRDISKYPNEMCYGMYHDSTSPYIYLPYRGQTPSGERFTATYGYQDQNGRDYIMIKTRSCDSYSIEDEVISTTKDYLEERGKLNADRFGYKVSPDPERCGNN